MSNDLTFNPACTRCGKRMGVMSEEEFIAIVMGDGDCGLCFDCDPDSAATTPSLFWQWKEGDVFEIEGLRMEVYGGVLEFASVVQSHAHARARARGLSSYTKVNRALHNHVLLADGTVGYPCRVCEGKGEFTTGRITVACSFCDGEGFVVTEVVLPAWIIGLGCEND